MAASLDAGTQRDRLQAPLGEHIEQARQRFEDHRTAAAAARRIAIVQQQDVAAAQLGRQATQHGIRVRIDGIEAAPRPTCESQLQARQNGLQKHVAQPRGCTKPSRRRAGQCRDAILRAADICGDCPRPQQRKAMPVPIAMIFDHMALCVNFPREVAMKFEPLADAEERCASAALAQENAGRAVERLDLRQQPLLPTGLRRLCGIAELPHALREQLEHYALLAGHQQHHGRVRLPGRHGHPPVHGPGRPQSQEFQRPQR